jgi:hypothetical protein
MSALHHGIDGQGRLLAAGAARQDAGPRCQPERLALLTAVWADEALRPFRALQISGAGGIVFEQPLEISERFGERQMFPLEYVGVRGHLGSLCQRVPINGEFRQRVFACDPVSDVFADQERQTKLLFRCQPKRRPAQYFDLSHFNSGQLLSSHGSNLPSDGEQSPCEPTPVASSTGPTGWWTCQLPKVDRREGIEFEIE